MHVDTSLLLKTVAAWVKGVYGESGCSKRLSIDVNVGDDVAHLPVPADGGDVAFDPTATQEAILLALKGGEMKTDRLVSSSGLNKSQLFEKGRGLEQLRAAGLVEHRQRVGYFLTEAGERFVELMVDD